MTVRDALEQATRRLGRVGVPSARHDAEWLLQHALGVSRVALLLETQTLLSADRLEQFEALLRRREAREPLQWIVGHCEFYGLGLRVRPGVLIPRPETERLVELALQHVRDFLNPCVLDLGCGSGAMALALKHARPDAEVTASDINPLAIALTLENAQALKLELSVQQTALFDSLGRFDLIVCNPPYLPQNDRVTLEPEVLLEPENALFSGSDGLGLARQIVAQAPEHLNPGGALLLELDPRNAPSLAELARQTWSSARLEHDLLGRERFVCLSQPFTSA